MEAVDAALNSPASLGEARHPLANSARLQLLRGDALALLGRMEEARRAWERSASFRGDFVAMNVQPYSDQSLYTARALLRLGRVAQAQELFDGLGHYVEALAATPAAIDYFATSLPTMLLFTDDPQAARDQHIELLRAQLTELGAELPGTAN